MNRCLASQYPFLAMDCMKRKGPGQAIEFASIWKSKRKNQTKRHPRNRTGPFSTVPPVTMNYEYKSPPPGGNEEMIA
jgi:hypothetical protein